MNKEVKKLAVLFFLLVSLGSSCLKERLNPKPKLPPITCGAERSTFGCYVNDNVFLPEGVNALVAEYNFKENPSKGTFGINAYRNTRNEAVRITLKNQVFDTGYYKLGFDDYSNGSVRYSNLTKNFDTYWCHGDMYGHMHITQIDTIHRRICGTFSFDAVNWNNNQDTVKIRDGRFDTEFFY